jgi:hypothetical protein
MRIVGGARALGRAIRTHRRTFALAALAVFALNLVLPPLILSAVRKPPDHVSFNPWLRHLPAWLASDEATWGRKLEFLYGAALYWFIADSPFDAPEWGYTATVRDVLRWIVLALLFGAYFALWAARRARLAACAPGAAPAGGRRAGLAGALLSTLGFSTLPCSVVGCGAPVLPVVGLVVTGMELSSATLAGINRVSHAVALLVYLGIAAGIVSLSGSLADQERRDAGAGVPTAAA